jgi:hypothetical protein
MRKHRVIKIKNPDCFNLNIMKQNYQGLWNILNVKVSRIKRGFKIKTHKNIYILER